MKKKLLFLFLALFLLKPAVLTAHEAKDNNWNLVNQAADQILQLGKQQKYAEAKKIIDKLSTQILKASTEEGLTVKEVKMVIYSYEQAEAAVTSVDMETEERINKLTQFRITANAVTSEHHPLWRDAEKMVLSPLEHAIEALKASERSEFQRYLNEFLNNYEIIRPALTIDLPEHTSERYDSYIRYLEHYRNQPKDKDKNKQLVEIQREFQALFQDHVEDSNATPELIGLIYTLGGIIAITLIYVGWRKYRGDNRRKKLKERE